MTSMELLAPAGNWDSFTAAINNGADAVYIGGQQYSARQSAANFDDKQMKEAILYAHLRGRKVYVAVNTLIDNNEFSSVLDYLFELQKAGADAVILQDMGLLNAVRTIMPGLRIHASTQMTIHNQDGAAFMLRQGVQRIVLARELSSEEISAISKAADGIELEVFVHGALCYSYSGQCLFSSMIGGRSGNRGRCAQPCRLPYELYSYHDKNKVGLPRQGRYLLSPADLCLIENLPELRAAGVSSLKIEGRMKRAEYVAVVTRAYRQALDILKENPGYRPGPEVKERLLKIFNRNFSTGCFIPGNTEFMSTRWPKNRGVCVGQVLDQTRAMITRIDLIDTVNRGDGIVVGAGQDHACACIIKEMKVAGENVAEASAGDTIEIRLEGQVFPHDQVFKTHDERLLAEAQQTIRGEVAPRIQVDAEVHLAPEQTMRLIIHDQSGNRVEVTTKNQLQEAEQYPLNEEILRQKIGRLGNTPFELRNLTLSGDMNLMVPFSDINDARRRAIELLTQKILLGKQTVPPAPWQYWSGKRSYLLPQPADMRTPKTLLAVAVSSVEQAETALQNGADRVYLGLEGLGTHHHLQKSQLHELLQQSPEYTDRLIPILPRIVKPSEHHSYRKIVEEGFKSIMIASWADLEWAQHSGLNILADYSLNIFNHYTLRYLCQKGIKSVCLSPELNLNQLAGFENLNQVELIAHGDLIIMQSQHCMLGGVQAPGKKTCSLSCRAGSYYIKDSKGYEFPIETDGDCRFYIFNSRTLCMVEDLVRLLALAPASIRIEARRAMNEGLGRTIQIYREARDRIEDGSKPDLRLYQQELKTISNVPFTKGHYYRGVI